MVPKIFSSSEKGCLQARESWPFGGPSFHWRLPAWFPGVRGERVWQACDPWNTESLGEGPEGPWQTQPVGTPISKERAGVPSTVGGGGESARGNQPN